MTLQRDDAVRIGAWEFSPRAAELRSDGERRALEDRAARLLAVLVRERGEVVTHEQLVSEVWAGRAVSPNSVAVVIGDLRRALGDNARAPKYIETIAKRGYRLARDDTAPAAAGPKGWLFAMAGVAAATALVGAVFAASQQPPPLAVAVAQVSNETGDAAYAPLARAVGEVVVAAATRAEGWRASRGESADAAVLVSSRLILWSGHPSVSITATDVESGEVIWSGIAPGPEDSLPAQVSEQMDLLAETLEAHGGR